MEPRKPVAGPAKLMAPCKQNSVSATEYTAYHGCNLGLERLGLETFDRTSRSRLGLQKTREGFGLGLD